MNFCSNIQKKFQYSLYLNQRIVSTISIFISKSLCVVFFFSFFLQIYVMRLSPYIFIYRPVVELFVEGIKGIKGYQQLDFEALSA